ncbi:hypothetical protein ACHAWU_007290 [Discostella pseudostelligera]|uniref:Uncharacterized protein n=1 Tax=Discostella pseudostelligera TaxID=259834 RepID=A0ABD3LX90_9STRA
MARLAIKQSKRLLEEEVDSLNLHIIINAIDNRSSPLNNQPSHQIIILESALLPLITTADVTGAMAEEKNSQVGPEPEQVPLLAIMGRFYPFDDSGISYAGTTLVIKEMQNQSTEGEDGGTGLNVWDGSLLLARYLEKRPELENVNINKSSCQRSEIDGETITCKVCDWFRPPPITELLLGTSNPDVILVADCVWLAPLIAPLLRTLNTYAGVSTKVIITYQQRGRDVHDEFWEGIHDFFDAVAVDTEKTVGLAKPDVFYLLECSKKR